jgi:hypothetical protein
MLFGIHIVFFFLVVFVVGGRRSWSDRVLRRCSGGLHGHQKRPHAVSARELVCTGCGIEIEVRSDLLETVCLAQGMVQRAKRLLELRTAYCGLQLVDALLPDRQVLQQISLYCMYSCRHMCVREKESQ